LWEIDLAWAGAYRVALVDGREMGDRLERVDGPTRRQGPQLRRVVPNMSASFGDNRVGR